MKNNKNSRKKNELDEINVNTSDQNDIEEFELKQNEDINTSYDDNTDAENNTIESELSKTDADSNASDGLQTPDNTENEEIKPESAGIDDPQSEVAGIDISDLNESELGDTTEIAESLTYEDHQNDEDTETETDDIGAEREALYQPDNTDENASLLEDDEIKLIERSKKNEKKERKIDALFEFVELFVFTLAAVFIITSFFFKYSDVDGASMINTLNAGDKLLLSCFMYEPEQGDIIVLDDKTIEWDSIEGPIVKRVIATEGQTVRITKTKIYVDGIEFNDNNAYFDNPSWTYTVDQYAFYISSRKNIITDYEPGEFIEITVPEGEIFVMGDNRCHSADSRLFGTVHEDSVIGKAILRFYPLDDFGKLD